MISFNRTSSGTVKVTDSSDGSVVTISNRTSDVFISSDARSGTVEIRTTGFYKVFSAASVQFINNVVPPNKSPDAIVDLLNSSIFITTQTTGLVQQSQTSVSLISISLTAGQNISLGQVVTIGLDGKAYIYDITNENNALLAIGISIQSAVVNGSVTMITEGVANVPGMSWFPGIEYYVGADGFPSSNVPTAPSILRSIGTGLTSSSIKLSTGMSVIMQ